MRDLRYILFERVEIPVTQRLVFKTTNLHRDPFQNCVPFRELWLSMVPQKCNDPTTIIKTRGKSDLISFTHDQQETSAIESRVTFFFLSFSRFVERYCKICTPP